MAGFDIVLVLIILLSAIFGLIRGFFKEIISLVTWIAAFVLAGLFTSSIALYLHDYIKSQTTAHMTAFFFIFVVVWVIGLFINVIVSVVIKRTGFSFGNRLWGGLFGIGRGILVDLLLVFIITNSSLQTAGWYKNSSLAYPLERICVWLRDDVIDTTQYKQASKQVNDAVSIMTGQENPKLIENGGEKKKRLTELETDIARQVLNRFHPVSILVISNESEWSLDGDKKFKSYYFRTYPASEAFNTHAIVHLDQLPVSPGAIDLLILPHVLMTQQDMASQMSEFDKLLAPEGMILVFGVNHTNQVSSKRMTSFLNTYRYDIIQHCGYHLFPVLGKQLSRYADVCLGQYFPCLSSAYWLLAKKRVYRSVLMRAQWKRHSSLAPSAKTHPIAGSCSGQKGQV